MFYDKHMDLKYPNLALMGILTYEGNLIMLEKV